MSHTREIPAMQRRQEQPKKRGATVPWSFVPGGAGVRPPPVLGCSKTQHSALDEEDQEAIKFNWENETKSV